MNRSAGYDTEANGILEKGRKGFSEADEARPLESDSVLAKQQLLPAVEAHEGAVQTEIEQGVSIIEIHNGGMGPGHLSVGENEIVVPFAPNGENGTCRVHFHGLLAQPELEIASEALWLCDLDDLAAASAMDVAGCLCDFLRSEFEAGAAFLTEEDQGPVFLRVRLLGHRHVLQHRSSRHKKSTEKTLYRSLGPRPGMPGTVNLY